MAEKYAVRNLRLCTKDCLCLYVCPTGATDTEDSIIDAAKCVGCGACADACPSGAISLVPKEYPPQQPKDPQVVNALRALIQSKNQAEAIAARLPGALAQAVEKSCRLMGEDLCREAGFMLPQSGNAKAFLESLLGVPGVPQQPVEKLLATLSFNDEAPAPATERWKCPLCGYIHEGPLPQDLTCPVCRQPASAFEKIS